MASCSRIRRATSSSRLPAPTGTTARPGLAGPEPAVQLRLGPDSASSTSADEIAPDLASSPGPASTRRHLRRRSQLQRPAPLRRRLQRAGHARRQRDAPHPAATATARRRAGRRASALRLSELTRPTAGSSGSVLATLGLSGAKAHDPAARHVGSILLTGPDGAAVPLDYRSETTIGTDPRGNLREIRLALPAGSALPPTVRAYVIPTSSRSPRAICPSQQPGALALTAAAASTSPAPKSLGS